MKKILMVMISAVGAMMLSAEMPRSEWHAKVGDCALDPNALKATIAQLSSADKTAFLAEVNEAISKMPGSEEVKASKFLAANRAAVAGAGAEDRAAVLAEVYATVPPEALTVINEEFAKNEFSRPATMTDDEYTNIVAQTMTKITQRTATAESGSVRAGFAGLMFIRAAGSASDATTDAVIASLPSDAQSDAKGSWFPSALGQNGAATYDPMLATAQAEDEPNHAVVVSITRPELVESMLGDLQAGVSPTSGKTAADTKSTFTMANGEEGVSIGLTRIPRDRVINSTIPASALSGDPSDAGTSVPNPYYRSSRHGGSSGGTSGGGGSVEPDTYWLQNL